MTSNPVKRKYSQSELQDQDNQEVDGAPSNNGANEEVNMHKITCSNSSENKKEVQSHKYQKKNSQKHKIVKKAQDNSSRQSWRAKLV